MAQRDLTTDAFNLFDRDRDGLVNTNQIGDLLRSIGFMVTQEQVQQIAEGVKKNVIELNDFKGLTNSVKAPLCPEQEMVDYFRVFDKNGDGTVQANELRHVMTSLGEKFTDQELDELITEADEDGTGNINYANFVKNMYESVGLAVAAKKK
jgi:calmodulin